MTSSSKAFDTQKPRQLSRRSFLGSVAASTLAFGSLPTLGPIGHALGQDVSSSGPAFKITVLPKEQGLIGRAFCGLSYEKNHISQPMFTGDNRNLIGLCRRLGAGVLRLGGNAVDRTMWDRSGNGRSDGRVAPADIDMLADFARATDWKVLYGVNLAQSTPSLAADEVFYVSRALGAHLSGIEIGNEPDNYVKYNYFPHGWGYADYLARWREFAAAIVARVPTSALTGPGLGYKLDWFRSFAADASKQLSLLTCHYYRGDGQLPTADVQHLISYPDTSLLDQISLVRSSAQAAKLPFRFTETNSFYNGGKPNVSNSHASALWVIDELFTLAANGCEGANLHGGGNGHGYAPIADAAGTIVGPHPVYYGMYFFTLAGEGKLHPCRIESTGLNISAYAVEVGDGKLNVMAVNKEPQSVPISIDLSQLASSGLFRSAALTTMTNNSLSATTGTEIAGSIVDDDGSINPHKSEKLSVVDGRVHSTLPPLSAALLEFR